MWGEAGVMASSIDPGHVWRGRSYVIYLSKKPVTLEIVFPCAAVYPRYIVCERLSKRAAIRVRGDHSSIAPRGQRAGAPVIVDCYVLNHLYGFVCRCMGKAIRLAVLHTHSVMRVSNHACVIKGELAGLWSTEFKLTHFHCFSGYCCFL